jgi:hypothetical protein
LGAKRDRWRSSFHSPHNGDAQYQRYQLKYQQAQQRPPVPLKATQDHQSTNKRPVKFPVTPHALKMPGQAQPVKRAVNKAHEGQRCAATILVATAHGSSRTRRRRLWSPLNKAAYHCGLAGSLLLVAVACQSARRNRRFTSAKNIRRIIIERAGLEAESVFGV